MKQTIDLVATQKTVVFKRTWMLHIAQKEQRGTVLSQRISIKPEGYELWADVRDYVDPRELTV